jgi:hypothetical protein
MPPIFPAYYIEEKNGEFVISSQFRVLGHDGVWYRQLKFFNSKNKDNAYAKFILEATMTIYFGHINGNEKSEIDLGTQETEQERLLHTTFSIDE